MFITVLLLFALFLQSGWSCRACALHRGCWCCHGYVFLWEGHWKLCLCNRCVATPTLLHLQSGCLVFFAEHPSAIFLKNIFFLVFIWVPCCTVDLKVACPYRLAAWRTTWSAAARDTSLKTDSLLSSFSPLETASRTSKFPCIADFDFATFLLLFFIPKNLSKVIHFKVRSPYFKKTRPRAIFGDVYAALLCNGQRILNQQIWPTVRCLRWSYGWRAML